LNTATTTADAAELNAAQDQQRKGRKRFLLTLPSFAVGMLGEVLAVQLGVAQPWEAGVLWAYTIAGLLLFYLLIDRGISARWRDPMMTFPQVLFGISLVALAYVVMPSARALAMQWLCLIIVYDVRRLGKGQTWVATGLAMVVPFIGFGISYWLQPVSAEQLRSHLVTLGLGAFVIPGLLAMSAAARLMKKVQRSQKEKMAEALDQMTRLSRQDGLTGLFNRRHMQEMLDDEARHRPAIFGGHAGCGSLQAHQ
jgi:diguanylate cyclase